MSTVACVRALTVETAIAAALQEHGQADLRQQVAAVVAGSPIDAHAHIHLQRTARLCETPCITISLHDCHSRSICTPRHQLSMKDVCSCTAPCFQDHSIDLADVQLERSTIFIVAAVLQCLFVVLASSNGSEKAHAATGVMRLLTPASR